MPKQKRQMTCKLCGVIGYNSRNCPTKVASWTVLTQSELDEITGKLDISVANVSQAQIDFTLSKRPVDFDEETLAHFYHNHTDRFELALKTASIKDTVTVDTVTVDTVTVDTQEDVALAVSQSEDAELSDEELSEEELSEEVEPTNYELLETVRWEFGRELDYLAGAEDEKVEIGNTIFIPTFRDDGSIHLEVMVNIQHDSHCEFYEFDSISDMDAEILAADWYASYLDIEESEEDLSEEDLSEEVASFVENEDNSVDVDPLGECSDEPLSLFDEDSLEDYAFTSIPEGAILVGFEGVDNGFEVLFYEEEYGYLQGTKNLGFSFSTELSFDDTVKIIENMPGDLELIPVQTEDLKILKFMKPDKIPFDLWQDIELDMTSEEFTSMWLAPTNPDIDSMLVGCKVDPLGRKWRVQAVCID